MICAVDASGSSAVPSSRLWSIKRQAAALVVGLLLAAGARSDDAAMARGQRALQAGDLPAAIAALEMASQGFARTAGPRHRLTLEANLALAEAYAGSGRGDQALKLTQDAARAAELSLGENHSFSATALLMLATRLAERGQHTEALPLYGRARRAFVQLHGERHLLTLTARVGEANAILELGRFDEAISLAEPLRLAIVAEFGDRNLLSLGSAQLLVRAYVGAGRFSSAVAVGEPLLQTSTAVSGERARGTLATRSNLVVAYLFAGRAADALPASEPLQVLNLEIFGDRHPRTLADRVNHASVLMELGRHSEALALGQKALIVSTEVLGQSHPTTLSALNELANHLLTLGRVAEGLAYAERQWLVVREGKDAPPRAKVMAASTLAVYRDALGRRQDAVALTEQALSMAHGTLGENEPLTLTTMSNLAGYYRDDGRRAEARKLIEGVVARRTSLAGPRHPDTLVAITNLMSIRLEMDDLDGLDKVADQTVQALTEVRGSRHRETLFAAGWRASILKRLGRTREALEAQQQVLDARVAVLGDSHPDTVSSFRAVILSLAGLQQLEAIASLGSRYVSAVESIRSQPGLSQEDRRTVFANASRLFSLIAAAQVKTGRVEEGFRIGELGKSRTLLDALSAHRDLAARTLPEVERQALEGLDREITALEALISRADGTARVSLEAERNQVVRRFGSLKADLRTRFPRFGNASLSPVVEANDVPGLVPPDAVAISYFVTGSDNLGLVVAWTVDSTGMATLFNLGAITGLADAVEIVRAGHASLGGLSSFVRAQKKRAWKLPDGSFSLLDAAAPAPKGAALVSEATEAAVWLGQRLLEPMQKQLDGKQQWIISPDGPLARLPFDLLRVGARSVLEAADVHYIQSLSVYRQMQQRLRAHKQLPLRKELLAVGNPDYRASPAVPIGKFAGRSNASRTDANPAWEALPGTVVEVAALRRLMPDSDALMGVEAAESRLRRMSARGELRRYRYVHFAVHGHLAEADPDLSSLVLSQPDGDTSSDGYLTAAELAGFDFASDLTVLSACDTGLGTAVSGEGVMGLPYALFIAGNTNTLLTLWPVSDDVTPRFMERFYARLKSGQTATRALAETKREFAADPKTRHPSVWAPFVLVGAG
jgi:CHAT domain-containing protein/tetratricopeptide (TPR) repeat protein